MSRSIDLFIDSPLVLDDFASELTRLTGKACVAVPDAPMWVLTDGDVVAELTEHHFANDRNLMLRKYRYCLSARLGPEAQLENSSPQVVSLRAIQAVLRSARYLTLLVWDLQNALARHLGLGDGIDELSLPPEDLAQREVEEPV